MKTHIHQPIIVFVDDPDSFSYYMVMVSDPGGVAVSDCLRIRYLVRLALRRINANWNNVWLYSEVEMNNMLENKKNDA